MLVWLLNGPILDGKLTPLDFRQVSKRYTYLKGKRNENQRKPLIWCCKVYFKCLTNLVPLSLCMLYIGISCNILLIKLRAARNIVWLPPTKFEWSYQRHIFVQRAYHAAIQSFKGIFLLWSMPSKVDKSIVILTSSQSSVDAMAYRWQIWKCHSLTDPYGANN